MVCGIRKHMFQGRGTTMMQMHYGALIHHRIISTYLSKWGLITWLLLVAQLFKTKARIKLMLKNSKALSFGRERHIWDWERCDKHDVSFNPSLNWQYVFWTAECFPGNDCQFALGFPSTSPFSTLSFILRHQVIPLVAVLPRVRKNNASSCFGSLCYF